jgi:hypothetical protein
MYGAQTLKPKITITPTSVQCPVLGCKNSVERQRQHFRKEARFQCPKHQIYISPTTFEYPEELDNLLWKSEADQALLGAIKKVKRESRMTRDNSEDALTWNVFRYLESASLLDGLFSQLTGYDQGQTELIYWSYSQKTGGVLPNLEKTRMSFGETSQRGSEPDLIAITDQTLFFIEAKLTASNNTKPSNPNKYDNYLIGEDKWYMQVFAPQFDFNTVAITAKKYELFRFWLLGSWMAKKMGRDFYLVNIVRSVREMDIEARFIPHIQRTASRQFIRLTWEEIYAWVVKNSPESEEKKNLVTYFENKTIGYNRFSELLKAFSDINVSS